MSAHIFPTVFCFDSFKDSPFREDAVKRNRYLIYTAAHPSTLLSLPFAFLCISDSFTVKAKEIEVLRESVRTENHRKRALEAQKGYVHIPPPATIFHCHLITTLRGLPTFAARDDEAHDFLEWNTEGIDWDRVAEKVWRTIYLGSILTNLSSRFPRLLARPEQLKIVQCNG